MEFARRGGQRDMAGTPPGRLKRSHGDEVAVERSGKLSRYKAETSDIKHQRARAFSFLLARPSFSLAPAALSPSHRKKFQLGFRLANGFVDIQRGNRLET